jgi:hypothetical protein
MILIVTLFCFSLVSAIDEISLVNCNTTECITEKDNATEELYSFDEPSDLYWQIKQHVDVDYLCPEENSISEIRNQINKLTIIKDKISETQIQEIKQTCGESKRYTINGIEPESEIKACYDHLSILLENNNLLTPNDTETNPWHWVYRECYIQEYFNSRFNSQTIEDYNASYFEQKLTERDQEFLDFVRYKIEFPKITLDESITDDEGNPIIQLKERTYPDAEEMKKICGNDTELAKYEFPDEEVLKELCGNSSEGKKPEFLPSETQEVKIPSKSILETIEEKIKSFFEWFK